MTADWKSVAGWLLQADVDDGVSHVLAHFGRLHGADRAWVIRYDEAFTHLWNTHEWTAPGIRGHVEDVQGVPVEAGVWLHEEMKRQGHLMIADVATMPKRARGLQAEFQRQGIQSLLALPVYREDRLAFQVGYDAVRQPRVWPEAEIAELKDAAELIAKALRARGSGGRMGFPTFAPEDRLVHLRVGVGTVAIPLSDIRRIEADGDYTVVHAKGGRRNTERRSVRDWEGILPKDQFIRIHRGMIVRADAIQKLDRGGGRWRVTLVDGEHPIPVGRVYRAAVRIHLGI
ncbi:LytTR family transcriptional regulator DNA-binding domain-containing protein [Luteolibacter marinus]|uniref:LytTR family transcriptional regulator DNA-binding domain-containing protein n=1 Tax=Luteolibacter marinus TaxID=2776705 RepID=UPI001867DCCD|nr:LytTR family transcriptional regulator DNA-binding domain-containing protein [Luteolibacter marinus]